MSSTSTRFGLTIGLSACICVVPSLPSLGGGGAFLRQLGQNTMTADRAVAKPSLERF
jgi:hypothetical protein